MISLSAINPAASRSGSLLVASSLSVTERIFMIISLECLIQEIEKLQEATEATCKLMVKVLAADKISEIEEIQREAQAASATVTMVEA